MTREASLDLLSQIIEIDETIKDAPDLDEISRRSLNLRREVLDKKLRELPSPGRSRFRTALTFAGRPVVGTYGIVARFAADAAGQFTEAVATVAASLAGPLLTKGQIPNRDSYEMLIVGIDRGSYGFVLEETTDPALLPTPVEEAVLAVQDLFTAISEDRSEGVADFVASLNPRALAATRRFLETLAANDAVCAIKTDKRRVQFRTVDEVKRSIEAIRDENVQTNGVSFAGVVEGVLPNGRRFEFRAEQTLITGTLDPDAEFTSIRQAEIHGGSVIGHFVEKRIGNAKPRLSLKNVSESEEQSSEPLRQIDIEP
ncbi:MAG TPA: hypothetical protein VGN57_07365 [Pirellulaceae bacterium]|jgi:hypothetical protein|nr:hypothetical protein [Pirellulaceae bacterium]